MPVHPRLTDYEKEKIREYGRQGIPAYKIAILVHHNHATVCNVLHPRPTLREMGKDARYKLTDQQIEEIKAMRRGGASAREISERYGIHQQTVFYYTSDKVYNTRTETGLRASKERWKTKPKEIARQVACTQKKRRQLAKEQKEAIR